MARHLAGPFGNVTGSGSSVTLTLAGTVQPSDLLLVCVIWEPLALAATYSSGGNTFQKWTAIDTVYLPGSVDFEDYGTRTANSQIGFSELPRAQNGRGFQNPYTPPSGIPPYPSWPAGEHQPSGIGATMAGYWHPDPYNELTFTFRQLVPSAPFSVTWCDIRTWRIAEWGGQPKFPSGTVGVNRPEPNETTYDTHNPTPPPEWTDIWHHTCPQGGQYHIPDPFPTGTDYLSDGGDTERHWGTSTLVAHQIEYGIAGRWGQGTGTFAWDTWPTPTLLATIDRAQTVADARFEIYCNLNVSSALNGCGTWGAQTYTQSVGIDTYRGPGLEPTTHVSRWAGGAMLRGASILTATTTGGWMPEIYRRIGPAQ